MTTARWDRRLGRRVEEELVVPASQRRLLVGMDESHLFVCPLKESASSVKEAHRKLAPRAVRGGGSSTKVKRQGEWFFLPVTRDADLTQIEEALAVGDVEIRAGITAAGRPHRVDRLVRLKAATYAIGCVRHPDHRVLELKAWCQVFRNTEAVSARPKGMTWVD